MHTAARGFAARPKLWERCRAVEIGNDTTAEIMSGWRNRQPIHRRIKVVRATRIPNCWETVCEICDGRRVEPHVIATGLLQLLRDRKRNDIARREIGRRMHGGHERNPIVVAQNRAFTAQRFGNQRARHTFDVHRSGMKLHELKIGTRSSRAQRERNPVAGRQQRVGGYAVALACAARSDHSVCRAHIHRIAIRVECEHTRAPAALNRQFQREPPFANVDFRLF